MGADESWANASCTPNRLRGSPDSSHQGQSHKPATKQPPAAAHGHAERLVPRPLEGALQPMERVYAAEGYGCETRRALQVEKVVQYLPCTV